MMQIKIQKLEKMKKGKKNCFFNDFSDEEIWMRRGKIEVKKDGRLEK